MRYTIDGADRADTDEVAAAVSAVLMLLEAEAAAIGEQTVQPSGWQSTNRLNGQGLPLEKPAAVPSWNTVERIRRAGRAGSGILGL